MMRCSFNTSSRVPVSIVFSMRQWVIDNNGMPLTVLSALARNGRGSLGGGLETHAIAERERVTQLASLLGALRNAPYQAWIPYAIAPPLIALLPCPRDHGASHAQAFAQAMPTKHPAAVSTVLTVLTYVIFMLFEPVADGEPAGAEKDTSTPDLSPGDRIVKRTDVE